MKLSKAQYETLGLLSNGEWRSAYPGLNMRTLAALEARNLVRSKGGFGSVFLPRTAKKWQITSAGKKAITD